MKKKMIFSYVCKIRKNTFHIGYPYRFFLYFCRINNQATSTMKQYLTIISFISLATILIFCFSMCAQAKNIPDGKFVSYQFILGGGMDPLDVAIFHLRYDEEQGKPLLTVSGDCRGEEITIEVGEEVFAHCLELINKHKLYRSKGFYKSKFEILDAPSAHFSIVYEDPFLIVSGSGEWPDFISNGINDIHKYLKSVVGDRKAEGHVDRIYGADGISGMHWTDGTNTVFTPKESVTPLKRTVRGLDTDADTEPQEMGYSHFKDGNQHYILIHDYQLNIERLFYSYDGKTDTKERMDKQDLASLRNNAIVDSLGNKRWPIVNERFLSHTMIKSLSAAQLEEMLNSIHVRREYPHSSMEWYTDIGGVNRDLLTSEIKLRKEKANK